MRENEIGEMGGEIKEGDSIAHCKLRIEEF
jgi:hypothetical protein